MLLGACSSSPLVSPRERSDFNADWRFHLGDGLQAAQPGFADNDWRVLDLPHDWAIEGDFSQENPSGTGGGALPGGVGWYRKTFSVDKADAGKIFRIEFDGQTAGCTSDDSQSGEVYPRSESVGRTYNECSL